MTPHSTSANLRSVCEPREPAGAPGRTQRGILDEQFARERLSRLLGTADEGAHALVRRATYEPLARVIALPGKGFRGRLVWHAHAVARDAALAREHREGAAFARAPRPLPEGLAQLVELIHLGSLIVDDIEDDALLRRGAPALHRQIGVPLAINAGNFLYFLPLLALEEMPLDDAAALAMHRRVARSLTRCHHGQALDLSLRVCDLAQAEVRAAVELSTALKTGALLELACALGAIAAGAPRPLEEELAQFGNEVGIALQMLDDLSGFLNPSRREKAVEDLLELRPTWAWALAAGRVDESVFSSWQRLAREVALGDRGRAGELICAMTPHLEPLRLQPRTRLEQALANLEGSLGALGALAPLARELRALEDGYVQSNF